MDTQHPSRRDFLTSTAIAAGALALPGTTHGAQPGAGGAGGAAGHDSHGGHGGHGGGEASGGGGGAFTFVHLTDMHVATRRKGDDGYRKCIESVLALDTRPDLAIMGGDLAFDGLYNPKDEFATQVKLYKEISDSMGIPYYNCMGNHDVLGWDRRRKVPPTDPDFGKKYIMDALHWEKPYYSFDHKGWHFAVLDCIHPIQADHGPGYEPRIGDEQLEWLAYDLGAAGVRPKIVMTHIAAFANIAQQKGDPNEPGMPGWAILRDTLKLQHILERHNVKALLQGHTHTPEEYRWRDVWYITSPAVSGSWWSGDWTGHGPGYTVFTCHPGGELTWRMTPYDWTAHLEPADDKERKRNADKRAFDQAQLRQRDLERAGR